MSRSRRAAKRVRLVSFDTDATGATVREGGLLGPQATAQWREAQERRRAISADLFGRRSSGSPEGSASPGGPEDDALHYIDSDLLSSQYEDAEAQSMRLVQAFMRTNHFNQFHAASSHDWGRRRARARYNWFAQRDALVDAYLAFIHSAPTSGAPQPILYPQHGVPAEDIRARVPGCIHLVDISGVYCVPLSMFSGGPHINATLLRSGYLGSTPVRPSIAFSVRMLQLFGRLRIRARTGKHNFVRVLCDLHNITFTRTFRNRFSEAAEAFTAVQRHVDQLVHQALGRDDDWRMREQCPACSYQCAGEEPLEFARQFALDGNNSMKRFLSASSTFESRFPFRYFKTREEVDVCKDEVHRRAPASATNAAEPDAAGNRETECTERWRNARPENEKTASWEELDETGIFVCVCRHGFVVTATDMWRSGELAKYPLSIVKSLIDAFGHEGTLQIGYDIGCAHSVTAANASFGDRVKRLTRFVVGSFHGHAHERLCQLKFHPRYVAGSGREDFEGCERLFSVNNFIAGLVRHATRYNRHELIESSFAAWDADKYASIGSLLLSKLREANAKIAEHSQDEAQRRSDPRYTDNFFMELLADEHEYLAGRSSVSQATLADELADEYSTALRRWWKACSDRDKLGAPFVQHGSAAGNVNVRKWLGAQQRAQSAEADLQRYEERLGIGSHERWTTSSAEYISATDAKKLRTYNDALDKLERGLADRLAVLEKLNKRETGYKLRKEIARNATRRGTALNAALQKYNDAARALEPPRPTLTREEVFDIAFLADFPVLRTDVADRPWAQQALRQMTTAWAETARAQEELKRIRIESVRIRAWIRDEEQFFERKIHQLEAGDTLRSRLLARELDTRAQLLFQVHTGILADLLSLDQADGQQSARTPGLRPAQHPSLALAPRAPRRTQREPLTAAELHGLTQPSQAAHVPFDAQGVESESSHGGSVLDDIEGEDLNGFFAAIHEIFR